MGIEGLACKRGIDCTYELDLLCRRSGGKNRFIWEEEIDFLAGEEISLPASGVGVLTCWSNFGRCENLNIFQVVSQMKLEKAGAC